MAEDMWNKLFKKIDTLEQEMKQGHILALMALDVAFIAGTRDRPRKSRIIKDTLIKMAEEMGMSLSTRDALNKRLAKWCEETEKELK